MSLGLLLTIIFLVLQLTHNIDWTWWQICLPVFIEVGLYVVLWILAALFGGLAILSRRDQ